MANPAAEARAKAQEKWAGATVHERGRKFIRHQHPTEPNRFMLDTSIGPIHYGAGEDQEIDTAWQVTTGAWQYEMTTNDWQTYARDTFNAGDIFRFEKDGEWVQFDPQSINWIDENTSRQQIAIKQAVSAVINDDVLEFPEGYGPGRHFQYQNQTARLQKLITIDADTDLPAVTLQGSTIWFEAEFTLATSAGVEVYLDGQLWEKANGVRVQTSDRIEFRDAATGQSVFWYLDFPRAWDSDESETIGQVEVRRQGGPSNLFITIRIPKAWIDTAIFPIYIDPTIDPDPQIGASGDDGFWRESDSSISTSANGAQFGNNSNLVYNNFSRFTVTGPGQADTCDNAYITFNARSTNSGTTCNAIVSAVDADDPAAPTTYTQAETATRTSASYSWNSITAWTANVDYSTPANSLDTVIQEIFDRGGWASGQHIIIYTEDNGSSSGAFRNPQAYDESTSDAARLHIEYTAADSGRGDLDRGIGRGILRGVGRGI